MLSYYKQDSKATCSLAVLRMVLAHYGIIVTEKNLLKEVEPDYGKYFSNIWNTTLAKLACQSGVETVVYALWPLFKSGVMEKAMREFHTNPNMDVTMYENPNDHDVLPEPLTLAYKEMFKAVELGCGVVYGSLTKWRINQAIKNGYLIQTTIKVRNLYPNSNDSFHSILIYDSSGNNVKYHDPYMGPNMTLSITQLIKATSDVGAFMVYKGMNK